MPSKMPAASPSSTVPKFDEVAGVDHHVDRLLLDDRAHQGVLVAAVDVADQQHPQRGVRLQRRGGVLLLERGRQGDEVAQVRRDLGGAGLDVGEDALVALERAEHAGRPEGLLPLGLVGRPQRRADGDGRRRPPDDPGHDEGGRRPATEEHGIPAEDAEHDEQGPDGEADDDRDGRVADGGAQLLRTGTQGRERDPGTRQHVGDARLHLGHGVDAGARPVKPTSMSPKAVSATSWPARAGLGSRETLDW